MANNRAGRTQQGNVPSPGQHIPGEFRPPARSTTKATTPAPARTAAAARPPTKTPAPRPPAKAPKSPKLPASARRGLSSARAVQRETGHGSFAPYQAIILGEFIAAELLVAITPIATRKHTTGVSPYVPRDMTKLAAIGVTYFLLETLAVGGTGPARIGAWLGGLVLLTVGLNEAANVAKDLNLFAGILPRTGTGGSPAGGPSGGGGAGGGKR